MRSASLDRRRDSFDGLDISWSIKGGRFMAPHRIFSLAVAATLLASQASAQDAQVMHWWTSGGESRAVAVFAKEYEKRGGKWIDSASVGPQAEHAAVLNAIAGGNPPSSISVEYRSCRPPAR